MPQQTEDDLFRESTMTFGQHLEELRKCLFKSAIGLALGFIVGLMVGHYVVAFIQQPLSQALTTYYQNESVERVQTEIENLKGSGRELPWTPEEVKDRVENQGLLGEEVYIDPAQMFHELKNAYPEQFKDVQPPVEVQSNEGDRKNFVRLFLWRPSENDSRMKLKSFNAQEAFGVYVKASLLVGVLLASPWIFYQIWSFVAAGLYPKERRYVQTYLPFSLGLFLMGAALAFFVVFKPVLNFLLGWNRTVNIDPDPRINEWLGFVLMLPVGFGVAFQLPLVMLFLERIGVFSVQSYWKQWRIAVLVIFVLAALLTPPDPYSMLLMACPLSFLYFGGILLCKLLPHHRKPH
jgi:sec-independent protein translocase protein TatC